MAASPYGLSIVLDFEDNASDGMNSAAGAFSNLSGSADALTMGISGVGNSLLNMNTSVVGMSVMGSQLQNMGQGMLGMLGNVAGKVIDTSSTFENFGITLKALYGSEEEANRVTNDLFKFATKSPFEVEDLTGMVLTLKSQGLEAFDTITNAATGAQHSTMEWIGNLQAFRPDESALKWKLAIQNFLAGDNSQSAMRLRNILDIGELGQFVGHDLGKTVEERMQSLTDIVEKLGIGDLMTEMQATWGITISNMDDVWSQFAYRIGYGNKDSNLYKTATQTMQNLLSAETDLFTNQNVIDATTQAFDGLVQPFLSLSTVLMNVAPAMSNWLGQHPQLIKWATGLTAVGGAGIYATGSLLKLSAGALNWILNVQRLGGLSGIVSFLGGTLSVLSTRMLGMGAVAGLGFLAWKTNAFGLRDALTSLGGQVREVFETTLVDLEDGKTLTESFTEQGLGRFAQGLDSLKAAGKEVGQGLYNGFANFFDMFGVKIKSMNAETFNFKDMLNNIGDGILGKFGGSNLDTFKQKYGDILSTVGTLGGSFLTAVASSTLLAGAFRILGGTTGRLLTNFQLIGSTLMSPTGLIGMGLTLFTLGYTRNFLGLQDLTYKIVDGLKSGMKELQGAGKIVSNIFSGKRAFNIAEKYGLQDFELGVFKFKKTMESFGKSILTGMKNSGTGIGRILTEMFPDDVDLSIQGILNAVGRLGDKVADFFGLDLGTGSISEKFEVLGQKIGGVLTKAALLLPAFKGFQTLMQNNINPLAFTGLLKGLSMVREGASTTFRAITNGFSGVYNSVITGVSSFRRFWGDMFHDLMQSGGLFGRGNDNVFTRSIRGMSRAAQSEFAVLGEMLTNDFGNMRRNIAEIWSVAFDEMLNGRNIGDTMTDFLQSRADYIHEFFEDAVAGFSTFVEEHASDVTLAVSNIASGIGTSIVGAVGSLAASIQMVKWQMMFGALRSGVQMFMGALGGAVKMVLGLNVAAVGLAALSSAFLAFGTLTTSDWSSLADRIKEQPTLIKKAGAAWDWFNEKLAGTTTKVNDFFAKFDISGGVSKVLDFVANLGDAFASIIGGADGRSGLADFGGRLISQFVDGIARGGSGIGASMQRILDSVTASIQTYAPRIGNSLGQLIGRAFQFAGRNAHTVIESAFTIMESFVKGLWDNRTAIMDGAFRIIDALCQGIITHGPTIIGYVGQLIDYFVSGLQNRDSEISAAANALIDPIMNIIETEGPKLWDLGKSVFGHLMSIVAEEITRGLASILRTVAAAAQAIALVIGGIGAALMFVPGMQPVAAGLLMSAGTMEGLALAAGGGALALDLFAAGLDTANDATTSWNSTLGHLQGSLIGMVDHSGNFVRTTSGSIKELSGSLDELNGKQGLLRDMWAKGETVHKVTFTEEGAEEVEYHVERIAKDDGTYEFKLVAVENDPSGKSLVDGNKSYAESNPMKQKLEVETGDTPDSFPNAKKDWWTGKYKPDTSGMDFGNYDEATIANNEALAQEQADRANMLRDFAKDYNSSLEKLYLGEGYFKTNKMNYGKAMPTYADTDFMGSYAGFSNQIASLNKQWESWGSMSASTRNNFLTDISEIYSGIEDLQLGANKVYESKDEMWTWSEGLLDTYKALKDVNIGDLFNSSSSPTEFFNQLGDLATKWSLFKDELEGHENEFTVRVNAETGELEIVKKELDELNDSEANPKVEAEGTEETKEELEGVKEVAEEVNNTEAEATVSQTGAEEATAAANETKEAVEEIPDEKNVTIETNTSDNGASVEQVAEAVKDFPTEDKTVHIHVVTDMAALSVIGNLKNFINEIPEEKTTTIGVNLDEGAVQEVQNLKTAIDELPTTVTVTEEGAAESTERVNALHTAIDQVKDKSVKVSATVSGKAAVDALVSSIAKVQSKSVTITATTVEQKGAKRATGGVVTASEAFTLMHEQGGEIVDLPTGSRVYPHDDSVAMSYADGYNDAMSNQTTQDMIASSPTTGGGGNSKPQQTKTTPTSTNHYDYSIHLGEGAIQLRVDNANGEADYKAAAEKMWKYFMEIQKRNQMARR